MPYRVGYFALAYAWDHHCRRLYDTIEGRIRQAEREAAQCLKGTEYMARQAPVTRLKDGRVFSISLAMSYLKSGKENT